MEKSQSAVNWQMLFQFSRTDPDNYRSVSLTSVPDIIREKIILEVTGKHLRHHAVIGYNQDGFMRGMSALT